MVPNDDDDIECDDACDQTDGFTEFCSTDEQDFLYAYSTVDGKIMNDRVID